MEEIKHKARKALEDRSISGFLGLKLEDGNTSPVLVTLDNLDDLEHLAMGDGRYPLAKILMRIAARHPQDTLGIMVRGCDERAIVELIKANQLDGARVVKFGVACPQDLAQRCSCPMPYPSQFEAGERAQGVASDELLARIEQMEIGDRLRFWMDQFGKCIKCYGCRNICPVCYCRECTLEEELLVPAGGVPPDAPVFHLIKAFHMMDRCIDCGLCEQTCPAGIPLRTIYRKMGQVMSELFDYTPGRTSEERSPLGAWEKGAELVAEV